MAESKLMGFKMPEFAHLTEADIEEIFGTPEERQEELRRHRLDRAFLNSADLEARYPGEFVSVHDCHVLAHAPTMAALIQQLTERGTLRSPKTTRKMPGA